jgi:signal transduction histidine kinase
MLRASPFSYRGEEFVLLSAADNANEMRRRELEQIFFHDVLNTAGGVQGLLHMMHDAGKEEDILEYLPIARQASDTLIDELLCQRDVAAAESGELKGVRTEVPAQALLSDLTDMFAVHPLAKDRRIEFTPDGEDLSLTTDRTLLSRVLVNLIKNALEAVPHGETVTVSCRREGGSVVFLVHNPTYMPPEVQHQVFQRSFSTKGTGRGVGTYSVRLLTEKYLGGKVSFTSDPDRGTTFRAAYPVQPSN